MHASLGVSLILTTATVAFAGTGTPAAFTQEAGARGVTYPYGFSPGAGHGICLADLDGDGDPDLVCTGGSSGLVGVHENDGTGVFLNRTSASGIGPVAQVVGVIAADYDADGDLDLHLSRWGAANMLLRNEGGFEFTDVTTAAGVGDVGAGSGCVFGDYDGDGWLDLYVANMSTFTTPAAPNRLYRNQGDGTFTDVAAALGVDDGRQTWKGVFFDYDRDGEADLYLSTDKGEANCPVNFNVLYRNDGGVFTNVNDVSGAGACLDSMGVAVGDFDANGWLDLYATNTHGGNVLLMNQGDGTFTDGSSASGTESFAIGWSCIFFDYDNDTQLELYVCNQDSLNRLYDADGAWPCVDYASILGVQVGSSSSLPSYCAATADLDDDGDLDLVVQTHFRPLDVFINHEGESRHWAKFDVVGEWPNTHAVGAQIVVRTGALDQLREVQSGTNFKSQNEYRLHYGLGDAVWIDRVEVAWPRGAARILSDLPADTTWTLYPPSRLGDFDGDGARLLDDFTVLAACYTGPGPGALVPGCEMMDYDGDGDVDDADFLAFLEDYAGPLDDCNDNGVLDLEEIIDDPLTDLDGNGVLDTCPPPCDADVNGDGEVDVNDLVEVVVAWGPCGGCPADVDGDGTVNVDDLVAVIVGWGVCGGAP